MLLMGVLGRSHGGLPVTFKQVTFKQVTPKQVAKNKADNKRPRRVQGLLIATFPQGLRGVRIAFLLINRPP
jgi:hypothetical protein